MYEVEVKVQLEVIKGCMRKRWRLRECSLRLRGSRCRLRGVV